MIYDASKILTGLVIFLGLATFPISYGLINHKAEYKPEPKIVTTEKQCVEATDYMKSEHMKLLNEWRDSVVRDSQRVYVATDGRRYEIGLSSTCMKCHSNKTEFCDQCHDYMGIKPNCWDCHVPPREETRK